MLHAEQDLFNLPEYQTPSTVFSCYVVFCRLLSVFSLLLVWFLSWLFLSLFNLYILIALQYPLPDRTHQLSAPKNNCYFTSIAKKKYLPPLTLKVALNTKNHSIINFLNNFYRPEHYQFNIRFSMFDQNAAQQNMFLYVTERQFKLYYCNCETINSSCTSLDS